MSKYRRCIGPIPKYFERTIDSLLGEYKDSPNLTMCRMYKGKLEMYYCDRSKSRGGIAYNRLCRLKKLLWRIR